MQKSQNLKPSLVLPGNSLDKPESSLDKLELARISPGLEDALPEAKSRNFSENTKIDIMHRYLALMQDFAYGFFWWPRCNQMKQTDNILDHTRREPKRINESWDIDEKPTKFYT